MGPQFVAVLLSGLMLGHPLAPIAQPAPTPKVTFDATQVKVVRSGQGQYLGYYQGRFVDMVSFASDGTAIHYMQGANRVVIDKHPTTLRAQYAPNPGQMHAMFPSTGRPAQCMELASQVQTDQMQYEAALIAMIIALGTGLAADVVTWGAAISLSGLSIVAVITYVAAADMLKADIEKSDVAGCGAGG